MNRGVEGASDTTTDYGERTLARRQLSERNGDGTILKVTRRITRIEVLSIGEKRKRILMLIAATAPFSDIPVPADTELGEVMRGEVPRSCRRLHDATEDAMVGCLLKRQYPIWRSPIGSIGEMRNS